MSVANILTSNGKIAAQYLPTEAIVTPTISEVLTSGNDAGAQLLTNLSSLNIGGAGATPVGILLNVQGNALCTGKLGVANNMYLDKAGTTLQIQNQDTGVVAISCDDGLQVVPYNTIGTGQISIGNGSATVGGQTSYEIYTPGTTGGGLTTGNMAIYGYLNGANGKAIFETDQVGANIELGSTATVGGAVVSVNGSTGAGRVYDSIYNIPINHINNTTFTNPATVTVTAGLVTPSNFYAIPLANLTNVGYNRFDVVMQITTPSISVSGTGQQIKFYLSTTNGGAFSDSICLQSYTSPVLPAAIDTGLLSFTVHSATPNLGFLYVTLVQVAGTGEGFPIPIGSTVTYDLTASVEKNVAA